MKLFVRLTLLALTFCFGFSQYSISKFEGLPFTVKPPSGMYTLGSLGFDNVTTGVQVLAYGDFNNDKYTDFVSLNDGGKILTIFVYSHDEFEFWPFATITMNDTIASVIPGDYDYDGQLDLLVITTSSDNKTTNLNYYLRVDKAPFFGHEDGTPSILSKVDGQIQPFVFDADGDRRLDLLYMENGRRVVHTLDENFITPTNFSDYAAKADGSCLDPATVINNKFATPHSNAFVDFNGDCAADLFITSVDQNNNLFFEIWLKVQGSEPLFCLVDVEQITYPSISAVSVGDIDNNGRMDLVFASIPNDASSPMNMHIIFNTFSSDPDNPCNTPAPMTSPFNKSAYNSATTINSNQVIPINGSYAAGSRLFSADPINRPSKIRIGDINIDGYPDLLFVIYDPSVKSATSGSIVLAINQQPGFSFTQSDSSSDNTGYFSLINSKSTDSDQSLSAVPALYASFFDFDELGRLGLWIASPATSSSKSSMTAGFNFVNSENFILKVLGLNGVPPDDADDITSSLGGIYYGASVECKVTDIDGVASIYKGAQMPQSAYTPLDLPYIFIGLGRTNNYVENFYMGIVNSVGSDDVQQTKWTPIIPNSQLIVNPLINKDWTLDVYVNPTSETILIVITTLVILVVLGALIIYLHSKEKEEDDQSRDRWMRIGVA